MNEARKSPCRSFRRPPGHDLHLDRTPGGPTIFYK